LNGFAHLSPARRRQVAKSKFLARASHRTHLKLRELLALFAGRLDSANMID
jgi:hypothetical protein